MSQDPALTEKRLNALWADPRYPVLKPQNQSIVMMSDMHFGDGSAADDFHINENALCEALRFYAKNGYSLILLGDIEEFWQFDLDEVCKRYNESVYKAMRAFGDDRIVRVFGNHDQDWEAPSDPGKNNPPVTVAASEAIKFEDSNGRPCALLVHGHQGSLDADKCKWFSRFVVRLYRYVEPVARKFGFKVTGKMLKASIVKDYEHILYGWAKKHRVILLCGHSHRAIFASESYYDRLRKKLKFTKSDDERESINLAIKKEQKNKRDILTIDPSGDPLPCYFNTGCGIYSDGLTTLEIENDTIRLIKWECEETNPRRKVYQSGKWSEIVEEVKG
ncbi:metallophosphoesterase family protein [candidate division KSB1 bacterium]|nr:metallophosphoesterase family protein [candidate division KSB1 bacterium]